MFATIPDLLRLVAIPVFGWVAYRDIETRRVPNRTWYPLAALALVLLVWEVGPVLLEGADTVNERRLLVSTALSIGIVIPLSYSFWLIGGFGGADAKAFFVVALLFPTYPSYNLWVAGVEAVRSLPVVQTTLGVFSLTILSNTVIAGAAYPFALAARNALTGYLSPGMFVAKPIDSDDAIEEYGTLLEFSDQSLTGVRSLSELRAYFSYRGLDLDALRMYLRWRGLDYADLLADPGRYRDPASLPADPNDPGTGVVADGGREVASDASDVDYDDPWGAEAFLDDIEGSAYGTTPAVLREGLDQLAGEDVVWISPGIPFLVPLFAGLLISLTVGDVLFVVLGLAGLV